MKRYQFSVTILLILVQWSYSQSKMYINLNSGVTDSIMLSDIVTITFSYSTIPTDAALGYWPLDGDASDLSGNGHTGTVNGGVTWTSDRHGTPNAAASFNGTNGYIECGAVHPSETNFSVSCWFATGARSQGADKSLIGDAGGYKGFRLYQTLDSLCFEYQKAIGDPYAVAKWGIADAAVGQWYHAVGVYTNGQASLYINGTLVCSRTGALAVKGTLNLKMGADALITSKVWNGRLDEVRIYNRALSPAEIQALHSAP